MVVDAVRDRSAVIGTRRVEAFAQVAAPLLADERKAGDLARPIDPAIGVDRPHQYLTVVSSRDQPSRAIEGDRGHEIDGDCCTTIPSPARATSA
jgi:hypothetical protein